MKPKSKSLRFLSDWLLRLTRRRPVQPITPPPPPPKQPKQFELSSQRIQNTAPPPLDLSNMEPLFPRFFDLPRELRDRVYEIYLLTPLPARPTTHYEVIRRAHGKLFHWRESCVKYPIDAPLTGMPLLLCSRQTHTEVREAMARLVKQHPANLRYILDCEIIGERYIYPTWMLLPVLTQHVPLIHVNIRSTGIAYPAEREGWRGNAGPPMLIWSLLEILQKMAAHGPSFSPTDSQQKQERVFIDTLVLDVLSCGNDLQDDAGKSSTLEPLARPFELESWALEEEDPIGGRPVETEQPALDALLLYIGWLFLDSRYTTTHAKNVMKAVRKICLLHNGVEVRSWDTQSYPHLQ